MMLSGPRITPHDVSTDAALIQSDWHPHRDGSSPHAVVARVTVFQDIQDIPRGTPVRRADMSPSLMLQGWTVLYLVADKGEAGFYRSGIFSLDGIGIAVTTLAALINRLERGVTATTIVVIDLGPGKARETVDLASRCRTRGPGVEVVVVVSEVDLHGLGRSPKGVTVDVRPRTIAALGRMIDRAKKRMLANRPVWPSVFVDEDPQYLSEWKMNEGWWLLPFVALGLVMWALLVVTF